MRNDDGWPAVSPWWLVAAAAAAMAVVGAYQFVWSSIRDPLAVRIAVSEASIGTVFSAFVVCQTLSQFPAGWIRDRYGPRLPAVAGAAMVAAGFAGLATADSLVVATAFYALGGVGVGATYTVAINTPVKWLDERRGLATGIVGFSYAAGSVLLIPLVRGRVEASFEATLLGLAALAGGVVLVAAVVLFDPAGTSGPGTGNRAATSGNAGQGATPATWRVVVRTRQFWLLYVVFVALNAVGLMLIGKVVTYAAQLGLPATLGTAVASLVALADASGVVVGGAASDRFGRVSTIAASLVACGLALALGVAVGAAGFGVGFLALVTVAAFFRTPAFSVFPTLVGEYWGEAHSSSNYAALYTAKLWGGLGGGVVAGGAIALVGWTPTFLAGAAVVAAAGLLTTRLRSVEAVGGSA